MNGLWMDIWKVEISNIHNPIHVALQNLKRVVTGHSGHSGHRGTQKEFMFL